jgi:hypothetical protein
MTRERGCTPTCHTTSMAGYCCVQAEALVAVVHRPGTKSKVEEQ